MVKRQIEGERIAKVIARAGISSRRKAESMILEGRITVNGAAIRAPNIDVSPKDKITVDGALLPHRERTRLWRFYKPVGTVVTASDERGRTTIFEILPKELPRVIPIGRLDLNSEGLILLTNNGELKRRLELPSTGLTRRYRVRAKGIANEQSLDKLRRGLVLDGERFRPIEISVDRQLGANAWFTVGIREGRNREIRRALEAVGMLVNRLIRVSFGPFQLADLKVGEIAEIRPKVIRDQLGGKFENDEWISIAESPSKVRTVSRNRRNSISKKSRMHRK
ncbi:MAG: pseudouridine synthase [Albidovulum sp.]|nr:pseudouridine synthase [Albidovulum sp.]MDE0305641.1 pseudouridine synthase [Albidovulum sp.]MDE0533637.1 pseudouridine synthase [Albidovulum sp.]